MNVTPVTRSVGDMRTPLAGTATGTAPGRNALRDLGWPSPALASAPAGPGRAGLVARTSPAKGRDRAMPGPGWTGLASRAQPAKYRPTVAIALQANGFVFLCGAQPFVWPYAKKC